MTFRQPRYSARARSRLRCRARILFRQRCSNSGDIAPFHARVEILPTLVGTTPKPVHICAILCLAGSASVKTGVVVKFAIVRGLACNITIIRCPKHAKHRQRKKQYGRPDAHSRNVHLLWVLLSRVSDVNRDTGAALFSSGELDQESRFQLDGALI
jgi:hypothetical protein